MSPGRPSRGSRQPWATPFAVTRPVFLALAGLVLLGMVAVLGGAAVRRHTDAAFRPDWAVWVPVTLGIGLGVLGLASLAMLAQRLPPTPVAPAGPLPRPVARGTARALRRGDPLTDEQAASAQQVVDGLSDRRRLGVLYLGPFYLLLGLVEVLTHRDQGWVFVVLGGLMVPATAWSLVERRRVLRRAAEQGYRPTRSTRTAEPSSDPGGR